MGFQSMLEPEAEMEYLIENQEESHKDAILQTFQNWTEKEPDVHLISSEGTILQTHKVILALYSAVLSSALNDNSSAVLPSISIPASTDTLENLVRILTTGISISYNKGDLKDVVNTAEGLGIDLLNIQIGAKGTAGQTKLQTDDVHIKIKKRTKKKKTKVKRDKDDKVKKEYIEVDSEISFSVNRVEQEQPLDVSRSLLLDSSSDSMDQSKSILRKEPLSCSECGKIFQKLNKLKRHLVIHTGEKPFSCEVCESKFSRKDKMEHHVNVKHNIMYDKSSHKCQFCKKAYGSNWYLNKHIESVHA